MTILVGTQKGGLTFKDLIFTNTFYCNKLLKIYASKFYSEGLKSNAKLNLNKQVQDLNLEKVFYNPMFRDRNLKTLSIPKRCERDNIFTYGEIVEEYIKKCFNLPHKNYVANIYDKIVNFDIHGKGNNTIFITELQAQIKFRFATHKIIYNELLRKNYQEHHSVEKWENAFGYCIDWEKVWISLNNPITSESVKTTIWEHIHLNSFCTYSYNKWHKKQDPCPFCALIPATKFHLTLECALTLKLWKDIEPQLMRIKRIQVTRYEAIFGLQGTSPGVILRNWLTFLLRHCIVEQEKIAYHNGRGMLNEYDVKIKFNELVKSEVFKKYVILHHLGRDKYFQKIFAVKNFLITWENSWWQIATFYQTWTTTRYSNRGKN